MTLKTIWTLNVVPVIKSTAKDSVRFSAWSHSYCRPLPNSIGYTVPQFIQGSFQELKEPYDRNYLFKARFSHKSLRHRRENNTGSILSQENKRCSNRGTSIQQLCRGRKIVAVWAGKTFPSASLYHFPVVKSQSNLFVKKKNPLVVGSGQCDE